MRRISKKRRQRQAEAKPVRDALIKLSGECEICGANRSKPNRAFPFELSQLAVHEIANGPNRQKALDKPYAILVLCWACNQHEVEDKGKWPEARQLAVLAERRPFHYDLAAYNFLISQNAPNRITDSEVEEHMSSELLNPQEVAEIMRVNRRTVQSWIDNNELRAIDVAPSNSPKRRWRIEPRDLKDFVSRRNSENASQGRTFESGEVEKLL